MSSTPLSQPAVASLESRVEESYIIRVNYADFSKVQIQPAQKIFKCSQCNKEITNFDRSEDPILTHNCNKFHVCTYCNDKFSSKVKLDEHLISHQTKVTKIKSCFQCVHCQKQFCFIDQLLKHFKFHFINLRYSETKADDKYCSLSKADASEHILPKANTSGEYPEAEGSCTLPACASDVLPTNASGTLSTDAHDLLSLDVSAPCSEAGSGDPHSTVAVCGDDFNSDDDTGNYVKETKEELGEENTLMNFVCREGEKKKKRRKVKRKRIIRNKRRIRSVIKQDNGNVQNRIHFACKYCNLSFDKVTPYISHLHKHRRKYQREGIKIKVEGPYTSIKLVNERKECTLCGTVFSSVEKLLFNHVTSYHPDIKTSKLCLFCGKFFHSKCGVNRHMRIHTGEKPFMCSECPYSCNRMDNLRKHFFTVHKELEFNV